MQHKINCVILLDSMAISELCVIIRVWQATEQGRKTMKTYTITGKTFDAKRVLFTAGFRFDETDRAWFGNEEAAEELRRISRLAYNRSNANAMANCEIVEVVETPAATTSEVSGNSMVVTSLPQVRTTATTRIAYGSTCSVCGERLTSRNVDTNYARGNYCGCEG